MDEFDFEYKAFVCEAMIDGSVVRFDAQSTGDLKGAIRFYSNFTYVGSTDEVYYNGEKSADNKLHHLFVRK